MVFVFSVPSRVLVFFMVPHSSTVFAVMATVFYMMTAPMYRWQVCMFVSRGRSHRRTGDRTHRQSAGA